MQSHRARHSNIAKTGIYAHELSRIENAGEKLIDYRKWPHPAIIGGFGIGHRTPLTQ